MANRWATPVYWRDLAVAERDRWPLWLPVALGTGAAGYFALPVEPSLAMGAGTAAGGLVAAVISITGRRRAVMALLAALLLGFGLAKLREARVATPLLPRPLITHLTARIVSLEPRGAGARLVLDEMRSGAFGDFAPRRVQLAVHDGGAFQPGDWVSLTASLAPPPAPVEIGAADFGRSEFFRSIGATGFAYGRARPIVAAHAPDLWQRVGARVESLRAALTVRIRARLPGSTGAIAAALITGERGGISAEDEAALRDAGLAHVLAIAGLHMALVGGGLFWLARAMLAAVPALALRYPIKKWAAAAALAASMFYLVLSGAAPPAMRAFAMLGTAMVAILLDRPALSMRSLALAAAVLLLTRPEIITEAGFQMSFAAVTALVAVAEWEMHRERQHPRGMLWRYGHGIVMTSLVGSLATWPFALFHFGRATHYAVLGNLIAMSVMGFWVMPAAALSVAAMPFGLDGPALDALGSGIAVMVAIGAWVSGLPGAVTLSPAMPLAALVAISGGGLWLAIWRRRWRWLGLAPILAGAVMAASVRGPDMLVAPDARTVAIRGMDGLLRFPRKPADKFIAREWLRRDGDGRDLAEAVGIGRCDGIGCAVKHPVMIAVTLRPEALAEDCARAAVLVSAVAAACKGPVLVIGPDAAMSGQGWKITLSALPSSQSVKAWRGRRPWVGP